MRTTLRSGSTPNTPPSARSPRPRAWASTYARRPLGNNQATSEQYIAEFMANHPCEFVVQVHSIAPLLTVAEIRGLHGAKGNRGEASALVSEMTLSRD